MLEWSESRCLHKLNAWLKCQKWNSSALRASLYIASLKQRVFFVLYMCFEKVLNISTLWRILKLCQFIVYILAGGFPVHLASFFAAKAVMQSQLLFWCLSCLPPVYLSSIVRKKKTVRVSNLGPLWAAQCSTTEPCLCVKVLRTSFMSESDDVNICNTAW